jgi:UDP-GlcNAc:undecaprenyl-phosphate GlcNAc-1-phosphate transferase
MDVALAVVRRIRKGKPVFAPDKEHIHHQLRDIGHTHRRAVLIMYYWSALLAAAALGVAFIDGLAVQWAILGGALLLIGVTVVPRRVRESRRRRAESAEPEAAQAGLGSKSA